MSHILSMLDPLPEDLSTFVPKWGPIGEPVYKRSYSRDTADGGKEQLHETVVRSVRGNLGLVDPKFIEADEEQKLTNLMLNFGIIPAGRHLYASGVKGRQFLFNCHASGWDYKEPWEHFTFLFDALMQGGGVGSNYSERYLCNLPRMKNKLKLQVICREDHPNIKEFRTYLGDNKIPGAYNLFTVEDSREGWVEAVKFILQSAWVEGANPRICLDVSPIREKGRPLVTSGGIACGPGPLVIMLTDFVNCINSIKDGRIRTLDAMGLDHILASCVVAGGKRRSSRMSVKSWKDPDVFGFISCKNQDGQHWSTNISVEVDDDFFDEYKRGNPWARRVMKEVLKSKRTNGEPGFWNRSLSQLGERDPESMYCPNPCGEIALHMWENCNLGHINLQFFAGKPLALVMEAFRLITRWLIRATFGDIPSPRQRAVVYQNRRIGVGFFGFHGWLALNGVRYSDCWKEDWVGKRLSQFRQVVDDEALRYAVELDIPSPIKTTTVAPTGTIALMPGVSTGCQPLFAPWFKRRVRYADTDPELQLKKEQGYPVYPDRDARNTEIVEYWCEDPLVTTVRNRGFTAETLIEAQDEIAFPDYLKVQAMIQEKYANNAISFTINLPANRLPSEEDMENDLIHHLPFLKGTTIFVDQSRANSPYERLTKEQFDAYPGRKEVTQVEEECKTGCPTR